MSETEFVFDANQVKNLILHTGQEIMGLLVEHDEENGLFHIQHPMFVDIDDEGQAFWTPFLTYADGDTIPFRGSFIMVIADADEFGARQWGESVAYRMALKKNREEVIAEEDKEPYLNLVYRNDNPIESNKPQAALRVINGNKDMLYAWERDLRPLLEET